MLAMCMALGPQHAATGNAAPALDLNFAAQSYRRNGLIISLGAALQFARASAGTRWTGGGTLLLEAPDIARLDHLPLVAAPLGLLIEAAATNKCANTSVNPVALTGITKGGDAAATLSVTNDAGALAAAGLSALNTSGNAFLLDNSAGTGFATATIAGAVGNTNQHTASIWWRETRGSNVSLYTTSRYVAPQAITAGYTRHEVSQVPASASATIVVYATAGAKVFFLLNQLEQGAGATSPIPVANAAATRAADFAGLKGVSGVHNVELTYDDDSVQTLAAQTIGEGWWPASIARPRIKRLRVL